MKSRFTPTTQAALLAAGWFEGRTVPEETMRDWLVINWLPYLTVPQGYSKITPTAWRVLREFGGLSIERANRADKPARPFVVNPLLVSDSGAYDGGLESFVWEIGASLFPLGTIEYDIVSRGAQTKSHAVAICDDGRVFALHYECQLLGNSIEEALEKIVSGEIDEKDPFDSDTDYDAIEEGRTRQLVMSIGKRIHDRERQLMDGAWPDQPTTLGQNKSTDYFAITDWDAEAARVARAFGADPNCHFFGPHKMKRLIPKSGSQTADELQIPLGDELQLRVTYNIAHRYFQMRDSNNVVVIGARLLWNGDVYTRNNQVSIAQQRFTRGLFNLGLLTPKIEESLKTTPTHHEKLEWQLECEG